MAVSVTLVPASEHVLGVRIENTTALPEPPCVAPIVICALSVPSVGRAGLNAIVCGRFDSEAWAVSHPRRRSAATVRDAARSSVACIFLVAERRRNGSRDAPQRLLPAKDQALLIWIDSGALSCSQRPARRISWPVVRGANTVACRSGVDAT
jgi:hypothetical protein